MYGYPQYSGYQQRKFLVNGRAGIDRIYMPPNCQDIFVDETAAILYLVQTDGAGYKTVYPFDISLHQDETTGGMKKLEERIIALEEAIANESTNSSDATISTIPADTTD